MSTLAILASAPPDERGTAQKALQDFQDGILQLVVQYGDGTDGPSGQGLRARGFDLDSKVQVFETVIRGVGGLLSAHLFAAGELPIRDYVPLRVDHKKYARREIYPPILWPNGFLYDGQLLRLAKDLAERLLPAFYTSTGMPYPRVNLRYGIPFYQNSPLNGDPERECTVDGTPEVTETCSAGAGSLVLEFTVLSRLTGDPRFEELAKRAFWSVWSRRSSIGLIGAGVDAEVGHWVGPYSGIGAGSDSFFEYAFKTHILLSGHELPNTTVLHDKMHRPWMNPNTLYEPLSEEDHSPDSFLRAWKDAHAAIKRHLYSNTHHPHYVNVHLSTGSPQAYWIDSLGAYYPGLLTLAGELEEAIETHLLYTALWTRYSAIPERWSLRDRTVEGGLGWWPGRPEFIESTYHIFRATKDPWYLYVGEMVLKDIKRRCWTPCGWAGLQDVRTGEKSDRMESFFLGETAKYMYLLFDPDHPLNSLDKSYVFTTEGHPLLIPRKSAARRSQRPTAKFTAIQPYRSEPTSDVCPVPPLPIPLTGSATAAREDLYHAASMIGLHHTPNLHAIDGVDFTESNPQLDIANRSMLSNHTYYPWTLPPSLIPHNAMCAKLPIKPTFNIEFPSNTQLPTLSGLNIALGPQSLVRVTEGILVKSLQGLKLGMVEEVPSPMYDTEGKPYSHSWRIWLIGNVALGRDEKVLVPRDVIGPMTDPSFTRVRDPVMLDLVIQLEREQEPAVLRNADTADHDAASSNATSCGSQTPAPEPDLPKPKFSAAGTGAGAVTPQEESGTGRASEYKTLISSLLQHVTSALRDPISTILPAPGSDPDPLPPALYLRQIPAVLPVGAGAALMPDVSDAPDGNAHDAEEGLAWTTVYLAGRGCPDDDDGRVPQEVVETFEVIVMRRGCCTFSEKMANIPSFTPSPTSLQLVIIVSDDSDDHDPKQNSAWKDDRREAKEDRLIRPVLDVPQYTPSGLPRRHLVPMVLVGGGVEMYEALGRAKGVGVRRRYGVECQGVGVHNLIVL